MQRYCTSCHGSNVPAQQRRGAPLDHNFDSLEGILAELPHVDEAAAAGPSAVNRAMPPSGPAPSDEERKQLGQWLACQAHASDHAHTPDEHGSSDAGSTQPEDGGAHDHTEIDGAAPHAH